MQPPLPHLEADTFLQRCRERGVDTIRSLWLETSLNSTQDWLWSQPPPPPGRMDVALALTQEEGRGQHHRRWHAPAGGLYLSCAFHSADALDHPLPPSIRLGCFLHWMLCQRWPSLTPLLQLKWPNDLWLPHGKCGGVLVEHDPGEQHHVVGIGLNLCRPDLTNALSLGPVAGLAEHVPCDPAHDLVDVAIDTLFHVRWCLTQHVQPWPLDPLVYWSTVDAHAEHDVVFATPQGARYHGRAAGIDQHGQYVVGCHDGHTRAFASGRLHREVPA